MARGTWKVSLCKSCFERPGLCLVSFLCCHAVSYKVRMRIIGNDMERYECCQGYGPRCCSRWERRWPRTFLALETGCCFAASVLSTRWYIMEKYGIVNGRGENALVDGAAAMTYASIPAAVVDGWFCNGLRWASDAVWCFLCACAQVQHVVELDARESAGSKEPPGKIIIPPTLQKVSRPS